MNWTIEIHARNVADIDTETAGKLADTCEAMLHNAAESTLWVRMHSHRPDPEMALGIALSELRDVLPLGWEPCEIHVITPDEETRQLTNPREVELAGIAEAAEILEVSKQRASKLLTTDPDAPTPIGRTANGGVYLADSIRHYHQTRDTSENPWKWR